LYFLLVSGQFMSILWWNKMKISKFFLKMHSNPSAIQYTVFSILYRQVLVLTWSISMKRWTSCTLLLTIRAIHKLWTYNIYLFFSPLRPSSVTPRVTIVILWNRLRSASVSVSVFLSLSLSLSLLSPRKHYDVDLFNHKPLSVLL